MSVNGGTVGKLISPVPSDEDPAVSPDGGSVAWIPSAEDKQFAADGRSSILILEGGAIRTVRYRGRFARLAAISSSARRVALVTMREPYQYRLVLLEPDSTQPERNLTDLLTKFSALEVERLGLCALGRRLVVGTRNSVVAIDLDRAEVVFESAGRFPALSPDGERLSFADENHRLVLRTLRNGTSTFLAENWSAYGTGSWSPDGRYLLAGGRSPLQLWRRLVAVNVLTRGFVELKKLADEGDYGSSCVWIKRCLLSIV
jgi:hypothetical protein